MKKKIASLLKKLRACPINLPWMDEGLNDLDAKYDKMCAAFQGIADDLREYLKGE